MIVSSLGDSGSGFAREDDVFDITAASDTIATLCLSHDTNPKRQLHEVLRSQGVLPRQQVTFRAARPGCAWTHRVRGPQGVTSLGLNLSD